MPAERDGGEVIGRGSTPLDRLGNVVVLAIGTFVACCGIGGLFFTASVLSYRLLEYVLGVQ